MGKKKSTSRKKKSSAAAANSSSNNDLDTTGTAASNSNNMPPRKPPPTGWAAELTLAEKAYKKKKKAANDDDLMDDLDTVLRLLVALITMRKFERGKQVVQETISSGTGMVVPAGDMQNDDAANDDDDETIQKKKDQRRTFQELSNQINKQLSDLNKHRYTLTDNEANFCRFVQEEGDDPDVGMFQQQTFANLGPIHFAAVHGRVAFFERLVAFGASIDHAPVPIERVQKALKDPSQLALLSSKAVAPQSWTALIFICSNLAMEGAVGPGFYASFTGSEQSQLLEQKKGQIEIAIQLVKLGADTSIVFDANLSAGGQHFMTLMYQRLDLHGKTAFQLAKMSKEKELIDVMTEYQDRNVLKKKVHCRCGSRLALRICHASSLFEEHHLVCEDTNRLCFRYSALAPCPCNNNTKKNYYNCCWEGPNVRFNNDRTGELFGNRTVVVTPEMKPMMDVFMKLKQARVDQGLSLDESLFPEMANLTSEQGSNKMAEIIQSPMGSFMLNSIFNGTKNRKFEGPVYGGCVARISNFFFWRDDHWPLDEAELLGRVKEWNQALEVYCKDLSTLERQRVMDLHKASPLAPCGNPTCNIMETKVKEFKCCSKCRKIGYCSRKCQGEHWLAGHRKMCV